MHCLTTYTFSSILLNLTFKISSHKILLHNYTFSLNECIALVWLLCHSTDCYVLILINTVISSFSCTLVIVFGLTLSHHANIKRLFSLLLPWNILTLVSSINSTSCIRFSSFFSRIVTTIGSTTLISLLILNEGSKVLHLLSIYV
jgi:hypothetical protein